MNTIQNCIDNNAYIARLAKILHRNSSRRWTVGKDTWQYIFGHVMQNSRYLRHVQGNNIMQKRKFLNIIYTIALKKRISYNYKQLCIAVAKSYSSYGNKPLIANSRVVYSGEQIAELIKEQTHEGLKFVNMAVSLAIHQIVKHYERELNKQHEKII